MFVLCSFSSGLNHVWTRQTCKCWTLTVITAWPSLSKPSSSRTVCGFFQSPYSQIMLVMTKIPQDQNWAVLQVFVQLFARKSEFQVSSFSALSQDKQVCCLVRSTNTAAVALRLPIGIMFFPETPHCMWLLFSRHMLQQRPECICLLQWT